MYGEEVLSTGSMELFKGALIVVIVRLWTTVRVWMVQVRKEYGDGSKLGGSLFGLGARRAEEVEGHMEEDQSMLAPAQ